MKPPFQIVLVTMAALAFASCDSSKTEAKKEVPPPSPTPPFREETRKLEGAAAIGVNSKTLRRNVDKILDAKDERNKQIEQAAKPLDEQ